MRYFVAILALAFVFPAMGATYYIDYSSGKDSNSGTSTSSPWQRQPSMRGFSGSYSHSAGDQFIFKGGVTWPAACFNMNLNAGGSASAQDYYGVNKTWYSGSSWSRPVFDGGGTGTVIGNFMYLASASYVTIDNIEMTDFYWDVNAPYGTSYIFANANNYVSILNCYFHGWTHASSGIDQLMVVLGSSSGPNTGCMASNCVFDGSASGGNSGMAVYCFHDVKNCVVSNMANGILPNGNPCEIAYNIIGPINESYQSTAHINAIEQEGASSGLIYMHHNVIFGIAPGVCCYVGNPGGPAYIYDNLIYDSSPPPIEADGRATIGAPASWIDMFNNTIVATQNGMTTSFSGGGWTLLADNNLIIDGSGVGFGGSTTQTDDLYWTSAQATAAGYSRGSKWGPTTGSGAAVSGGVNLMSYNIPGIGKDLLGNPRPATGAWDVGAYQWTGTAGGGGGGNVTSNSPPVVSAITQNAADVDPNTTGLQLYEGTTVQYSGTATDPNNDPITWQWSYTVNGGSSVVFQSGSGTVLPINFTYATGSAGNTYVWTLSASDGQLTARSQLTVSIESPPVAQAGLSFAATSGIITAPMISTNGYIVQPIQTGVTNGGMATYTFSITNAGSYVIQALVNAPSDSQNSFYVSIDALPTDPYDTWQIPITSGFQNLVVSWQGTGTFDNPQFVPEVFSLSTGTHQLYIVGRESNTQLQTISILKMLQPPQNLRVLPMIVNAPTFPVTQ